MITMTHEDRELVRKTTIRIFTAAEEISDVLQLSTRHGSLRWRQLAERRARLQRIANDLVDMAREGSWT